MKQERYVRAVRAATILDRLKIELKKMIDDIPHQSRATTINKGYLKAIYQIQEMIEQLEAIKWKLPGEEDD